MRRRLACCAWIPHEEETIQVCSIVWFVAMAALLWTFAGTPDEAHGQSGATPASRSGETSLELTRSERRQIQIGLAAEGL